MRSFDLPPSLTHDARGYAVCRVPGFFFTHVLVIEQERTRDVYGLQEATEGFAHEYCNEFGNYPEGAYLPPYTPCPRSFIVRKCGGSDEGLYLVALGARPSCQCFGYNRWQNCKHCDALLDLVKRGGI